MEFKRISSEELNHKLEKFQEFLSAKKEMPKNIGRCKNFNLPK
jgi:hypothetical protein